jgi:mono/diheme cytochrome c family protein
MVSARGLLVSAALGSLLVSLAPASASAQKIENKTARPIQSVQGVDTFKAYCAVCHGPEAKGNGPAAPALKKAPADLTTIAKRNGGTFSQNDVETVILGTGAMISHGSREMPIWGPVFRGITADDAQMKLRVANLIGYLRSLQVK